MTGLGYSFLMPPAVFIFAGLPLSVLALVRPRAAVRWAAFAVNLVLYVSSLPIVAQALLLWAAMPMQVEGDVDPAAAQAIVVLGAGIHVGGRATGEDSLDALSLERVAAAARLYRRLHLPVAVTGGPPTGAKRPLAALMKDELEHDFSVPVSWSEDRASTTFENAQFSAALLKASGIGKVILVTDAWHMPRAAWAFRRAGLAPLMYPSTALPVRTPTAADFLPSVKALQETFYAVHELAGLAYYRMRY